VSAGRRRRRGTCWCLDVRPGHGAFLPAVPVGGWGLGRVWQTVRLVQRFEVDVALTCVLPVAELGGKDE
jgi:hypothetical protein